MSDTELKSLSARVNKLTARVEALERLLQRIIQQRPVSERQLERALRNMKRSDERAMRLSCSGLPLYCYSGICSPDPPCSAGKSLNFGSPSRTGRTVSA